MRIEKEGRQQEHAECILPSVPVAGLNESQEKGDGPPGPFQLTKTAAQEPGAGACLKDREGERTEGERGGEERSKVQDPSTYMGCVLSSDWCGEEEVQSVPVVRHSSLKRRSLERRESGRMRLTKVSVCMQCSRE